MSNSSALATSYDEIPFPSQSLPQSHPDRLAAVATLFGMRPQPIDRCRVLELGCASGTNLIPMAERHPESTFVGVDFSARQIASAQQLADELQLSNIELKHLSIMDLDDSLGPFDYIIAHGFFSWVSPPVRERLLAICKSHLAPQGVAYVSYNIYPGWHLRSICRELMCGATPSSSPPRYRVAEGRKLLDFFSRSLAAGDAPYNQVLKADIDAILNQHDNYLLHDFFEEENHPLYFHEFVERATAHELQYLGDATPATMFAASYGPAVEQNLMRISSDIISMEQHLDLLRNRAFRQTLLCHRDVGISRRLDIDHFAKLCFAAQIRPKSPPSEMASSGVESFETPTGVVISSPSPTFKAALAQLGHAWPLAVSFEALAESAASRLAPTDDTPPRLSEDDRHALAHNLMQCVAMGAINLHSDRDRFIAHVTDRPRASPLARLQAHSREPVTNRRHEPVRLDELTQNLLQRLDGEHDRKSLLQLLIETVDRGELSILVNGIPARRGNSVVGILETTLDESLAKLATSAVLVA